MTPILLGRWQSRLFLMGIFGSLTTALFGAAINDLATPFIILGYVLIVGLYADIFYDVVQKNRWDHDWPPILHFGSGVLEGAVMWLAIMILPLPGVPEDMSFGLFLAHYSLVWVVLFAVNWGPMKVLFPWWRFRGGRVIGVITFDDNGVSAEEQGLNHFRAAVYPLVLAVIYSAWITYMTTAGAWDLFNEHWSVSVTMTLGSFVAGATAEGGAAVAFPVFTKVLNIDPANARTFGLMIQAVGMSVAGIVIFARGIKIAPRVIFWVTLGGIVGQYLGQFYIILPNPYPRILFTFIAAAFGVAMFISRFWLKWEPVDYMPIWGRKQVFLFLAVGLLGGVFAAQTGSGIDMATFVVLTLAFGLNEKVSTPTTVIIMALNSIAGFFFRGAVAQDIGVAWEYWLVAIPIVIIGAPLGATVASRVTRDAIIYFLLFLITLEVFTTVWLVPFTMEAIGVTVIAVTICAILFTFMIVYRSRVIARILGRRPQSQAISIKPAPAAGD